MFFEKQEMKIQIDSIFTQNIPPHCRRIYDLGTKWVIYKRFLIKITVFTHGFGKKWLKKGCVFTQNILGMKWVMGVWVDMQFYFRQFENFL